MTTSCDHVHHVRTQLPYTLVIGALALIVGYLPAAFGLPPAVSRLVALVVMVFFVLIGKKGEPFLDKRNSG